MLSVLLLLTALAINHNLALPLNDTILPEAGLSSAPRVDGDERVCGAAATNFTSELAPIIFPKYENLSKFPLDLVKYILSYLHNPTDPITRVCQEWKTITPLPTAYFVGRSESSLALANGLFKDHPERAVAVKSLKVHIDVPWTGPATTFPQMEEEFDSLAYLINVTPNLESLTVKTQGWQNYHRVNPGDVRPLVLKPETIRFKHLKELVIRSTNYFDLGVLRAEDVIQILSTWEQLETLAIQAISSPPLPPGVIDPTLSTNLTVASKSIHTIKLDTNRFLPNTPQGMESLLIADLIHQTSSTLRHLALGAIGARGLSNLPLGLQSLHLSFAAYWNPEVCQEMHKIALLSNLTSLYLSDNFSQCGRQGILQDFNFFSNMREMKSLEFTMAFILDLPFDVDHFTLLHEQIQRNLLKLEKLTIHIEDRFLFPLTSEQVTSTLVPCPVRESGEMTIEENWTNPGRSYSRGCVAPINFARDPLGPLRELCSIRGIDLTVVMRADPV